MLGGLRTLMRNKQFCLSTTGRGAQAGEAFQAAQQSPIVSKKRRYGQSRRSEMGRGEAEEGGNV